MALKIYFAGPNVFHLNAKEMEAQIASFCKTLGVEALIPGDTGIDWSCPNQKDIAKQIFDININHIRDCDAVIANVTPFRGACVDDGTAWEIGYAFALNKPVISYGWGDQSTSEIIEKVAGVSDKYKTPKRDLSGDLIEDFGLQSNLMIACATVKHFHLDFNGYEDILAAIRIPINFTTRLFD